MSTPGDGRALKPLRARPASIKKPAGRFRPAGGFTGPIYGPRGPELYCSMIVVPSSALTGLPNWSYTKVAVVIVSSRCMAGPRFSGKALA